jgi:cyclin H
MRESRLTDAEMLYTPSQIALASFALASRELAERWAMSKGATNALAVVDSIAEMIQKHGNGPDVEAVREVDRRLRLCKNPEKVKGSKAYNAKIAEGEMKAREKRERKGMRQSSEGDPFGETLSSRASMEAESLDDDD